MSQTLCKIEVFPAFAIPTMSTLNRIFGTRRRGAEAGAGAGDDRTGDGAGDGRTGSGDETGAGAGTGEATAAGAGDGSSGTGARQQIIWRIPMARKCFEKTGQGVDHTLESGACIIHTVQTSADWYYYAWRGMPFILFTLIDGGLATHLLALAPNNVSRRCRLMADTNPTLIRHSSSRELPF